MGVHDFTRRPSARRLLTPSVSAALALVVAASAVALAASAQTHAPAARPFNPAAVRTRLLEDEGSWSSMRDLPVAPHSSIDAGRVHEGFGVFVLAGGHSVDVVTRSGWAVDPNVWRGDFQAGVGWKQGGVSALVGYVQPHASAPRTHLGPIVGFTLAIHTR